MAVKINDEVDALLTPYSDNVRETALALRRLVLEMQPNAVEQVDMADKLLAYGTGLKMGEVVCIIAPFKNWVNVGFYRGTSLPDPDGLLTGTGKRMRHVKVSSPAEAEAAGLRRLLEAAWQM